LIDINVVKKIVKELREKNLERKKRDAMMVCRHDSHGIVSWYITQESYLYAPVQYNNNKPNNRKIKGEVYNKGFSRPFFSLLLP
jgi:hypothetical protein